MGSPLFNNFIYTESSPLICHNVLVFPHPVRMWAVFWLRAGLGGGGGGGGIEQECVGSRSLCVGSQMECVGSRCLANEETELS